MNFLRRITRLAVVPLGAAAALLLLLQGSDNSKQKEEQLWRLRNLGKALYENQTTQADAVDVFRRAVELAPDSLREHVNYGLALLRARQTEQGRAELEMVQKKDPSIPHTWFNLGILYKKQGDYEKALEQFRRMATLDPAEPVTHFNIGVLHRYLGKPDEAVREFETAARLDPSFAAPLFQIFDTYREAERGEPAEQALKRFQLVKQMQEGPEAASEDTNWSYYSEIYETLDPRNAVQDTPPPDLEFNARRLRGTVDAATAGLVTLDFDGDGRPDLLIWSSRGILLFRNGATPVDMGLGAIKGVASVAPGDYNNDGLPDLCVLTDAGATVYVNKKEKFEKSDAALPAGHFRKAVWLDYDHDLDLDLFLFGDRSALLLNRGDAGFEDRTAAFPFAPGSAIDAAPFRLIADSKALDLVVSYQDHAGVLYRDRLLGKFETVPLDSLPAGASSLVPHDIDNDGAMDLAYRSPEGLALLMNRRGTLEPLSTGVKLAGNFDFADLENRGVSDIVTGGGVLRNRGLGRFEALKTPPGFVQGVTLAGSEFDCDARPDVAMVTPEGSVHLLTADIGPQNNWLTVTLVGVKNQKLAAGAEVEVKAGTAYQKKIYSGFPLTFGLGGYKNIDTVRITWPNGMIQNETRQAAGQMLKFQEAPRLSGSCPMIYTWNGKRFEFVTDVLGVAPLGASAGDGKTFALDHDEYVRIPGSALVPVEGSYDVRITEELSEVSYLDQTRLIAVDHPRSVEVFSNDKWKSPPFPEFRLFGVTRRIYPRAARDGQGRDVLSRLRRLDRVYVDGFERDYAGVAKEHALELDFGGAAPGNRAVLVLTGWVDWADGSAFLAASQESAGGLRPPYLQVRDARGQWKTVIEDMGMPSGKTKTIAVDLSGKFLSDSRQVRIVTNLCVYWDEVFLGEEAEAPPVRLTALPASSASLRFRGFSKVQIDPQRRQPEYFDYGEVSPVSNWNATPGRYTRYGDVRQLVTEVDDRMVVMGSGDELRLSYDAATLPLLPGGWTRDYLLLVDGWAKDRDANTLYSQTVEPLPWHGMKTYGQRPPAGALDDSCRTRPALVLIRPLISGALSAHRLDSAGRQ